MTPTLTFMLLIAWRMSQTRLDRLTGTQTRPRDCVTEDCFRHAYIQLVVTSTMHGSIMGVMALSFQALETGLSPAMADLTLAVTGFALTIQPLSQSLRSAALFAAMQAGGRGRDLAAGDYFPSLVALPLIAAAIGVFG